MRKKFGGGGGGFVYACSLLKLATQRGPQFLDLERRRFSKIAICFSSACCTEAVGIVHELYRRENVERRWRAKSAQVSTSETPD